MEFQSTYKRLPHHPEKNLGERIVETAGYMTNKQKIESILNAGRRLVDYRKEQYDFQDVVDEDFFDPTRSKNFDMADATILARQTENRLKAQKKAHDDKIEAEKDKSLPDLKTAPVEP